MPRGEKSVKEYTGKGVQSSECAYSQLSFRCVLESTFPKWSCAAPVLQLEKQEHSV